MLLIFQWSLPQGTKSDMIMLTFYTVRLPSIHVPLRDKVKWQIWQSVCGLEPTTEHKKITSHTDSILKTIYIGWGHCSRQFWETTRSTETEIQVSSSSFQPGLHSDREHVQNGSILSPPLKRQERYEIKCSDAFFGQKWVLGRLFDRNWYIGSRHKQGIQFLFSPIKGVS